jgi:hypothetical protein
LENLKLNVPETVTDFYGNWGFVSNLSWAQKL